ncbi:MAG: type II toxin-antitoxin system RatA family toxin [Proteobacteria bacterium]|nr:type II toxin-antitoxin system RatA family toxin [Pseudomonadota bacterium]MDE3208038.1 type II toxin-antitoxin system RatA family toxin [Pseudomonadota bacterium]
MAQVEKSVIVLHSARQMFDLVDKVENYAQFLPWCGGTSIDSCSTDEVVATVRINYHGLKQSFTTRNYRQAPSLIRISLEKGPFHDLCGEWRFIELEEKACRIEFYLNYTFSSRMLEKVVGPVFDYIANSFVEAFIAQADSMEEKDSG